jgi:hypothetical protein
MINKKAQILEENTLKIILVCISIVILVGLLIALYGGIQKSKQSEQASAILKQVGDKVNSLNSGKSDIMTITGPKGWYLFVDEEKRLCVVCTSDIIGGKCTPDLDKRCVSVNAGTTVNINGGRIEIYIVDLIFVKQNEIVSISKK